MVSASPNSTKLPIWASWVLIIAYAGSCHLPHQLQILEPDLPAISLLLAYSGSCLLRAICYVFSFVPHWIIGACSAKVTLMCQVAPCAFLGIHQVEREVSPQWLRTSRWQVFFPLGMSLGWTLSHSSCPLYFCIFKGFSLPTQLNHGFFPFKLKLIDSSPAFLILFPSSDWNNINPHCFSFYLFVCLFKCNMMWPQYKLDNQAQWLENVTSEFQMLMDCDCFCHRISMIWKISYF